MADSGGHWKTLAEAAKLTASTKIPGVFEEDIKLNPMLDFFPVAQAAGTGLKIEWLREKTTTEDAVLEADIGDQLTWSDDVEYDEAEATLRTVYIQRKLNNYVQKIYGTYNDYKAQMLLECEKGLKRKLNDRLVYADTTYGGSPTQFDGLHALAAEKGTPNSDTVRTYSDLNLDQEDEALSLNLLRLAVYAGKLGWDAIWVPPVLGIRFDEAYEERGLLSTVSYAAVGIQSMLTRGFNDIGKPITYFSGIPVQRTDYLVAEQTNTGTGATANKRAKYTSGTRTYSVFLVHYGNLMEKKPGICFAYGGTEGAGDLYRLDVFDKLEDYDCGGYRLVSYATMLLSSTPCLGRIHDIYDLPLVV